VPHALLRNGAVSGATRADHAGAAAAVAAPAA
jgi:hypothetical protein